MEATADLRELLKAKLHNADQDVKILEENKVVTADVWCALTREELKELGLSMGAFALLRSLIKHPPASGADNLALFPQLRGVQLDFEKLYVSSESQQDSCQSAFQTFLAGFSSELQYGGVINFADIAKHLPDGSLQTNQLYLRKSVVDIFSALSNDGSHWLLGPPGTGKTLVGWLLAFSKVQQGKKVLMISERSKILQVYRFHSAQNITMQKILPLESFPLMLLMGELKREPLGFDVVILDGLEYDCALSVPAVMLWRKVEHICLISSGQLSFKENEAPRGSLLLPGWTLEEYLSAFRADKNVMSPRILSDMTARFDAGPDVSTAISSKHNLVGACARLMFAYTCDEAATTLMDVLAGLNTDDKCDIVEGKVGRVSRTYRDRLTTYFPSREMCYEPASMQSFFLSKFVLQNLRTVLDLSRAKNLHSRCVAMGNPSMIGWAFEEYVQFCPPGENSMQHNG
eukprot:GILK01012497.1.p1 GENE.GILK01012497.1~~GILK01012497.1.p1  ORF type:complete len:473 (+),score=41.34 GILK01012497.1:45-1421(+)